MTENEVELAPFMAPTRLPSPIARAVALGSVVASSVCGGLIGYAFAELSGAATGAALLAGLVGSLFCAGGVALMAVLVLRSMSEWTDETAPAALRSNRARSTETRPRRRTKSGARSATGSSR